MQEVALLVMLSLNGKYSFELAGLEVGPFFCPLPGEVLVTA
jgi:hypothetical protein